jgi:hypothetical protein
LIDPLKPMRAALRGIASHIPSNAAPPSAANTAGA